MILPLSVDLRLTSRCNLKCPFCFGSNCMNQEMNYDELLRLIDQFWEYGVRNLVLTGGEPMLYGNLLHLMEYAKNKGYRLILSTNGLIQEDVRKSNILPLIDWISLPIDGEDFETCYEMRGITQQEYSNIFTLMYNIKQHFPNTGIKIGTVVTRINIDRISRIYYQITGYADVWKLYQVCPHENNSRLYSKLKVEDHEFDSCYQKLTNQSGDNNNNGCLKIVPYKSKDTNGMYLFCEPDGTAFTIREEHEFAIGNFLSDFDAVVMNNGKYIDLDKLIGNLETTYFYRKEN